MNRYILTVALIAAALSLTKSTVIYANHEFDDRTFLFEHEQGLFEEEEIAHVDLPTNTTSQDGNFKTICPTQLFNETADSTPLRVRVRGDGFTLTAPQHSNPLEHRHMAAFVEKHKHNPSRKQRRAALHQKATQRTSASVTDDSIAPATPILAETDPILSPDDPTNIPVDISFPPLSRFPPGGSPPARVVPQRHVGLSELNTGQYEYALLIDAGSTGSRIYLYRTHPRVRTLALDAHPAEENTGNSNDGNGTGTESKTAAGAHRGTAETHRPHWRVSGELEMLPGLAPPLSRPVTESGWSLKMMPGVSDYHSTPLSLHAEHMQPLLNFALALMRELGVEDKVPHTPVFFTATGGVRALQDERREALLRVVRASLRSSGFYFEPSFARVLAGEEEGVFGWLTVNYLASNRTLFWRDSEQASRHTVGALDLGGASMQATFRPRRNTTLLSRQYSLRVAQIENSLYTECFWYFGKDSALWRVHNILYAVSFYADAQVPGERTTNGPSEDELGLYARGDRVGEDMDASELATTPVPDRRDQEHSKDAQTPSAAPVTIAPAPAVDVEADVKLAKLARKQARKDAKAATRAKEAALQQLLPVDWDLPLNSTRLPDDTSSTGTQRAFASPCLPTGFSASFRAFNDDVLRVVGRTDWDACYDLAVHLVHTRTTGPCHTARERHDHNQPRPGLRPDGQVDLPHTKPAAKHAMAMVETQPAAVDGDATSPSQKSADKAAAKLARAGVKAREGQRTSARAWSHELPYQGQCTSFFGLYAPDLSGRLFHAFSGFAYLPVFLGLPTDATLHELAARGRELCTLSWDQLQERHPHANKYVLRSLIMYYLRSYCWLSVYAVALLHEGFGFPLHGRSLRWTQKMAGTDVTYALGAALYELNKLPWSIAIDYGHLHAHDRDDDLDVPGASPASSSSTLSTFTPASSPTAATTVLLATYDAPATTATHAETLAVTAHPAAHHALSVPPVSLPVTVTNAEALRSVDVMRVGDGAVCPGAWAVGGPDQVPSDPQSRTLWRLAALEAETQYYRHAFHAALCALLAVALGGLYLWVNRRPAAEPEMCVLRAPGAVLLGDTADEFAETGVLVVQSGESTPLLTRSA